MTKLSGRMVYRFMFGRHGVCFTC